MILMTTVYRIDSYAKLEESCKFQLIKIGDLTLTQADFKSCYTKPWKIWSNFQQKKLLYKQIRAKFLIIAKLIKRYIQYHRQCQYLISFINSRYSYNKSKALSSNKLGIIEVMHAYLEHFTSFETSLYNLEKVLKFLEDSDMSIKSGKVPLIQDELYKIEKCMLEYCAQMNELLRTSDQMITTGSYDDRTLSIDSGESLIPEDEMIDLLNEPKYDSMI